MIEVNNLTANKVDTGFLKKVSEFVLDKEDKKASLSIVLVGSARMRALNKKYRGKNKATDVLSFSGNREFAFEKELGEVVICLQEVKKNAKRLDSSYNRELALILIHGILHLLDYDHKKMELKQNNYLSRICQSHI